MRASKMMGVGAAVTAMVMGCGESEPETGDRASETKKISVFLVDGKGDVRAPDAVTTPLALFQDEDGAWQPMQRVDNAFVAELEGERYGVAIGCAPAAGDSTSTKIQIQHATVSERDIVLMPACVPSLERTRAELAVAVSGLGAAETALMHAGRDHLSVDRNGTHDFEVAPETRELFATAGTVTPLGHGLFRHRVRTALRLRDLDPAMSSAALDFGGAGLAPVHHRVVMHGSPVAGIVKSFLETPSGRYGMGSELDELATLPAAARGEGDRPRLQFSTGQTLPEQSLAYTPTNEALEQDDPIALALGAPFRPSAPLLLTTQRLRPVFLFFPIESNLASEGLTVEYFLRISDEAARRSFEISMTEAWVAESSPVAYKMPDFSLLPGWTAQLEMESSAELSWHMARVEQSGATGAAGTLVRGSRVEGHCRDGSCTTELSDGALPDSVELLDRPWDEAALRRLLAIGNDLR
jgi:hypothetical protein